MFFDIFAFIVFGILFLAIVVAVVTLGSLPGNIARRRGHPQADAITAAGWIGIASMGVLWPIAFVWAFLRPANNSVTQASREAEEPEQLADILSRLTALELTMAKLQTK
jgi:amino acid transporter